MGVRLLSLLLVVGARASVVTDPDLGFELLMSGIGGPEVIRHELKVEGTIPGWLNGILVQNGGGRFEWPSQLHRNLTNAGDGYAKLDVFTFSNGTATYTSKFSRSAWWNKSVVDLCPGYLHRPAEFISRGQIVIGIQYRLETTCAFPGHLESQF